MYRKPYCMIYNRIFEITMLLLIIVQFFSFPIPPVPIFFSRPDTHWSVKAHIAAWLNSEKVLRFPFLRLEFTIFPKILCDGRRDSGGIRTTLQDTRISHIGIFPLYLGICYGPKSCGLASFAIKNFVGRAPSYEVLHFWEEGVGGI